MSGRDKEVAVQEGKKSKSSELCDQTKMAVEMKSRDCHEVAILAIRGLAYADRVKHRFTIGCISSPCELISIFGTMYFVK